MAQNKGKGLPQSKESKRLQHIHAHKKATERRNPVRVLWRVFWIGVIAFNLLIILINFGVLGYMPSMKELENPSSALSSESASTFLQAS